MKNEISTILGLDPGYDRLGWAIGIIENDQWKIIKLGCIQTNRKDELFSRYKDLSDQLKVVIANNRPTVASIESLFFFKNKKTALKVSESRGVVLGVLLDNKIPIYEYTPLQIKQAVTGYGKADKKAVEKMVRMEFKNFKAKIIDDAIDALAVAMTHVIRNKNRKFYA